MSTPKKSFWSTVPGLVTGIAGIVGTIVGLGTLLVSLGVIGDKSSTTGTTPAPSDSSGATSDSGGSSGSTAGKVSFTVNPPSLTLTPIGNKDDVVTVINQGTLPLTVKKPDVTGSGKDNFEVEAGDCTTNKVPAGGSCQITVTLVEGGDVTATMTVSAENNSAPERVALTGKLL